MKKPMQLTVLWVLASIAAAAASLAVSATTHEIWPKTVTDCDEEFENLANSLAPGDELILHGGIYSQSCRRAVTANGTSDRPIVIRAAAGETPVLTRPADNIDTQNNIEVVDSTYLVLRGLAFKGGSSGVQIIRGGHLTIEDCEIYETGNNAIPVNSGNVDSLVIRRNHIHHTGLSTSGSTEGEGMYLGCNYDGCRVTNSLIEGNWIHHLRSTSDGGNDGIEVKPGSWGNTIRDNVIHDTNIGREYPCIFVYGGGDGVNVVEGNALWNCGEAIQVVSDAVVRNNLILNSSIAGITAAPQTQVSQIKNVSIVNNTIYGHPECVYVRWSNATNMVLANNAIYCGGATAVNASLGGATVVANYIEGSVSGASLDGTKLVGGGTAASAFVNPATLEFWPKPGSPLIGKASAAQAPQLDFNATARVAPFDVGAYETEGLAANPGWKVRSGFKSSSGGGGGQPPAPPEGLRPF